MVLRPRPDRTRAIPGQAPRIELIAEVANRSGDSGLDAGREKRLGETPPDSQREIAVHVAAGSRAGRAAGCAERPKAQSARKRRRLPRSATSARSRQWTRWSTPWSMSRSGSPEVDRGFESRASALSPGTEAVAELIARERAATSAARSDRRVVGLPRVRQVRRACRCPFQGRQTPGRRVVTSWTSHVLPSGSLKEQNDP